MDRTDYLTISERVTNDWKEKLDVLRSHHRCQSREQQTQHLEELRILQEDLLKDITHFMTIVKVDGEKNIDSSQEGLVDAFEEANSLQEQTMMSMSSAQAEPVLDNMTKMAERSETSLSSSKMAHPPSCMPLTSSLVSSMKAEHPQDSTVDTSIPSLNVFSTAFSNGTLTEPSVHTSAVAVASQALPSCGEEGREQDKLLKDVAIKLQDVVGISEEPSRTSQVAKFDRHMQDLRTFYESEISVLKEKLSKMENCGSGKNSQESSREADVCGEELKSCNTQSTLNSFRSSDGEGNGGKVLQEFCKRLQEQLEENEMRSSKLREENENITSTMRKLQVECDASEMKIKSLEQELKQLTAKLEEQASGETEKVQAEMDILAEQLKKCKQEREQDLMNIDELLQEVEELQMENRELHNITIDCKMALEERNNEIESLKETVKMHKATEDKYKSVILGLESDLRHLEHSRNKDRSLQTHYTLGDDRKSHRLIKSHSSEHFLNLSSCRSPIASSGRLKSLLQTDTVGQRPVLGSPKVSTESKRGMKHLVGEMDHHPKKLPPSTPTEEYSYGGLSSSRLDRELMSEGGTPKTPLTKQKWLESSDPGLFGSTTTPLGRSGGSFLSSGRPTKSPLQLSNSDVRIVEQSADDRLAQQGMDAPMKRRGTPSRDSLEGESSQEERVISRLGESAVQAVKDGRVVTEEGSPVGKDRKKNYGDWWKKRMSLVAREEARLADLGAEKEQLESALQRAPKAGGIVNRHDKRVQMEREHRLEEVLQEMGRVRMTLKKHRAL